MLVWGCDVTVALFLHNEAVLAASAKVLHSIHDRLDQEEPAAGFRREVGQFNLSGPLKTVCVIVHAKFELLVPAQNLDLNLLLTCWGNHVLDRVITRFGESQLARL